MKKSFFVSISLLIIIFALSLQIERPKRSQEIQITESISSVENKKDIDPPLLIEEDIINPKKVVEQVEIKSKVTKTKDLNTITAEAYLMGNLNDGKIYIENNINQVFPIASLSKLFTALVVVHSIDEEEDNKNKIIITKSILNTYGEAGHLKEGDKFTARELLYPLLLESSNDAAEAIAQSFGYEKFIEIMNSLALEIGMNRTSFQGASGLNPSNISNIKDLFTLSKYLFNNEKGLLEMTKQKEINLASSTDHSSYIFTSINPFVDYKPFIGGKTGRTEEAKESMISLFNIKKDSIEYPVAVIILRSEFGEREMDTERVLEKGMKKI